MHARSLIGALCLLPTLTFAAPPTTSAPYSEEQVARGKYLVRIGGCTDCHTPGHLLGRPETNRLLGGSDVGLDVPNTGIFVGPNLTPDKETGLGNWTDQQVLTAITGGVRPDGRVLMPVMPWPAYAALTREDALAIVAYLRSLPPVRNRVPSPLKPGERSGIPVFKVVFPQSPAANSPAK